VRATKPAQVAPCATSPIVRRDHKKNIPGTANYADALTKWNTAARQLLLDFFEVNTLRLGELLIPEFDGREVPMDG
jgi:hypothetical protein